MSTDGQTVPPELTNAIKMLGDEWTLQIICNLSRNKLRFNELQRAVEGINPSTLVNRLKKMEKEKIIKREEETLDKLSVVYELTPKGRSFLPVTIELRKFAEKFYKKS